MEQCKILIIDKKLKYPFLFKGFRKRIYVVTNVKNTYKLSIEELKKFDLFFMVLYDFRDAIEIFTISNQNIPIITASENIKILKKLQKNNFPYIIDLSVKINMTLSIHECIKQIFN